MQHGMLFHAVMDETSPAYVEQTVMVLSGEIDVDAFKQAFQLLTERYEILRTVFVYKTTKQPRQVVLKEQDAESRFTDISRLPAQEVETYLDGFCREDRERGFDLTKGPLMRLALFKESDRRWRLAWSFHHILMDGWCLGILFKCFNRLYNSLIGAGSPPMSSALQYGRYIKWLEKQDKKEGLSFWNEYLDGYEQGSSFPVFKRVPPNRPYLPERHRVTLDEELTRRLHKVAINNRVTMNSLVQALWGVLLQHYSNNADVVFGSVVSGRPAGFPGVEDMVGLFINTVPVRVTVPRDGKATFARMMADVQKGSLGSRSFEYVPLAEIQDMTPLKNRLFDHIMAFENYPLEKNVEQAAPKGGKGLAVEHLEMREQTGYALNVVIIPGAAFTISFDYNREVFDPSFIEQLGANFETAARQVANDPYIDVREIDFLTMVEKWQLLADFNHCPCKSPLEKTLIQLFEEQVEAYPDRIALVGDMLLSYRQLNDRANRFAHILAQKGITADTLVGLVSERTVNMIIAIMGIMKAGGAYLPVAPSFPDERIKYILADSAAPIVVSSGVPGLEKRLGIANDSAPEYIDIDRLPLDSGPSHNLPPVSAQNLAYSIYTSGTTGIPKGVLTTHANVVRIVKDTNYLDIEPSDRFLQLSSYTFDPSAFDIFAAFCNGSALVLMPAFREPSAGRISDVLKRQQVTAFFLATALFNTLVDHEPEGFENVRKILFGGERVSVEHVKKAFDHTGPGRIIHLYGPTETTIYSSAFTIESLDEYRATVPIGGPVSCTSLYVLSPAMQLVPVGVAGELFIGGPAVARGYLNRPELTHEAFVVSPIFQDPANTIYRTGDLVRWMPEGHLEFVGRVDRQIKLRGFRVELGEIESCLRKHPEIKQAFVMARGESSEKHLCAFLVPTGQMPANTGQWSAEMRAYVAAHLPDHMIPLYFIPMDTLPVNHNGKIDTRALPQPEVAAGEKESAIVLPRNHREKVLVELFAEILGQEPASISIDQDFFDSGGHSLRAMALTARIHKELDVRVPLNILFESPTVQELALFIEETSNKDQANADRFQELERVQDQPYYPVTSAQKRLFIFQQINIDSSAYNIPAYMVLNGKLDSGKLQEAAIKMVERHESLRTSFHTMKGETVQQIHDTVDFAVDYSPHAEPVAEADIPAEIERFVQPFDLSRAPLIRARLMRIGPDRYLFLVDMHHIITDGASMGVFFREFTQLYSRQTLEPLQLRYRDYSHWQNRVMAPGSPRYRQLQDFWVKHLDGKPKPLDLPLDFPRPAQLDYKGEHYRFSLAEEHRAALEKLAAENDSTVFIVLLAVTNIWLAKLTGREDIVVGTPVEGRPHADLTQIIGMFVNTLVLRNLPRPHKTFKQFMDEVKQRTIQGYDNQDYQLEDLIRALEIKPAPGRNPLFDVLYTLQEMEAEPASKEESPEQELTLSSYPYKNPVAKFDLMLTAYRKGNQAIDMVIEYPVSLFKEETIERFSGYFNEITEAICKNPETRIVDIRVSHDLVHVESHNPDMDMDLDF